MSSTMDVNVDIVRQWDAEDPLRVFREAFALPTDVIYLDGNSLGALPHATTRRLSQVISHEWGQSLIRSWDDARWMEAPGRVGDKIARIVSARQGEVTVADSTSVNLFKIAAAACMAQPGRTKLLAEAGNFPTDRYVLEGLARVLPGMQVITAPASDLLGMLDTHTAAVLLCHVHYRSGERHDMGVFSRAARAAGALSLWDLSHSVGAVPVRLNEDGADMAVGCGYKFLNGGPGAPAFIYVAAHLQERVRSPIEGWIGHSDPFAFRQDYQPADGVQRFLSGTPPILSLLALESGVDVFLQAPEAHIQAKSARMFDLFADLTKDLQPALQLLTPVDAERRGSQIAFSCENASSIMKELIAKGIIGDYRPPDIIRFGLTPLYTTYEDIRNAAAQLRTIVVAAETKAEAAI